LAIFISACKYTNDQKKQKKKVVKIKTYPNSLGTKGFVVVVVVVVVVGVRVHSYMTSLMLPFCTPTC